MKHTLLLYLICFGILIKVSGQTNPKTILHLQSDDSLVHKSVVSQVINLKKAIPDGEIEVLCHGPGLSFLMKKNPYINRILAKHLNSVTFVGSEFTMSQQNVKKDDLIQAGVTVPFGIAEIIKRQQEGWIYIKLGF
jgi:uncharacterized protein